MGFTQLRRGAIGVARHRHHAAGAAPPRAIRHRLGAQEREIFANLSVVET